MTRRPRCRSFPGVNHAFVTLSTYLRMHVAEAGNRMPRRSSSCTASRSTGGNGARSSPPLAERYRVVAPDLLGAGWTDAPHDGYTAAHDFSVFAGFRLCFDHPRTCRRLSLPRPRTPEGNCAPCSGKGIHVTGSSRRASSNHTAHLVQRDSGFQFGHPPSGARCCVRGKIAAGTKLDGDVIRRPVLAAQLADGRHGLRELIHTFEVDREEPVVARCPSQRLEVSRERRSPHWYSGLLHRPREELHIIYEVMLAPMVDRLAGPGRHKDRECLVEHLAPRSIIDLLPGLGELPGELVAAQTHAEDETATAEPIQRRGFPCHLGRAPARKWGDHGAQHHLFGRGRDRRQGDPRIGHLLYRLAPAELIPHKDPVPAPLLRLCGQPRHNPRVGKLLEQRQPQTSAHVTTKSATESIGKFLWPAQGDAMTHQSRRR